MSKETVIAAIRSSFTFEAIGAGLICAGESLGPVALLSALKGEDTRMEQHSMEHIVESIEICNMLKQHSRDVANLELMSMTHNERVEAFSEALDDELVRKIVEISKLSVNMDPETIVERLEANEYFTLGDINGR